MQELLCRTDGRIEPILAQPQTRSGLAAILDSIRLLASADQAFVIRRDGLRGPTMVVEGSTPEDRLPGALQAIALPYDGDSRWIEGRASGAGVTGLLVGLPDYDDSARHAALLLTFGGDVTPTRTAIDRILPAISAIIESHLVQAADCRRAERRQLAAMAALQQSECGVVVVRADHRIVLCNDAAEAILAADSGLSLQADTLRPANYHDTLRFNTAIDCIADQARSKGAGRASGVVMLLPRPKQKRPLIAVITPVCSRDAGDAAAIIYLLSPDQSLARGLGPICASHGLSQVETRLAIHLVSGFTITEAAADMRIKPATARSYLKQIFAKTNTHRQVDLVQLLGRYLRAVRGDFDFCAG